MNIEKKTFDGHKEAEKWFNESFPDQFIQKGSGRVSGEKIHFYHLINNRGRYEKDIRKLIEDGIVNGHELVLSYYIIGILEDGRVHIIY